MSVERPRTIACVFAALGILIALKSCQEVDTDLFFHIKEGERIVTQGRLPLVEDYSFTAAGRPMIATEWLAQAVIYAVFRVSGYGGLVLYHTALLLATLLILWRLLGRASPWGARLFLLALTAFGLVNFYSVRIHYYTFLFIAAFLYWIRRWEEGEAWPPWAMAASLLPWANMHGGYMAGWVMLGAVCLLGTRRGGSLSALRPWAAGTAACCIHPSGVTAFVYPIWFLFSAPASRSLVLEWTPVNFTEVTAIPYAIALVCIAWTGLKGLENPFPWGGLTLAFMVVSLRGRKLLPLFLLSAAATLGLKAERHPPGPREERLLTGGAALLLAALGWVVLSRAGSLSWPNPAADWERGYPRAPVEMLAQRYPGRRLFHSYDWGGYLIYKLSPGTKVFVDGRLEPYWDILGKDYRPLIEGAPGWQGLLERHRIETVLIKPYTRLAHFLVEDKAWRAVYSDPMAILFVRDLPAPGVSDAGVPLRSGREGGLHPAKPAGKPAAPARQPTKPGPAQRIKRSK
ncbi:MAG: hypothetical protein HY927_06710 [Elusimicrobia bacterium]|nr:hypothetical protein [Elusimicrobiota bacterium]